MTTPTETAGRPLIRPGQPWLDTTGNRIQAHGGSILTLPDGRFAWYGENKERTLPGSGIWHWGVRAYTSTDLCEWQDEGLLIGPQPEDPSSPLHPAQMVDRPHIVFHAPSGRYVCWLKIMGADGHQRTTVLTAPDFFGPYEIVTTGKRPLGMDAGDFDLVIDPTDQKAYYYFERVHSELICADLDDEYTGVTGYYSTHFPEAHPPFVREAPAYFRRSGTHYLVTSGTTGYYPNRSLIASALSYHGPWTMLGDLHPSDTSATSFRSQISSVFRHPRKKDLFIALADRWRPDLSPEESDQSEGFARYFSGQSTLEEFLAAQPGGGDAKADTSLADYVWLPLRFDGPTPRIEWRDSWHPDEFE